MLDTAALPSIGLQSTSAAAVRRTIWALLLFWTWIVRSQASPYTPTTILLPQCGGLPCQNQTGHVAYILAPGDSSVGLRSINVSSSLRASSPNADTLTAKLPFLDDHNSTAFTASISEDGIITVLAGECSSTGAASVWTYDPTSSEAKWTEHETGQGDSADARGPSFLGASLSFSATIAPVVSPPTTYIYGGMCPWSNASASTWQSAASYSNQMRKVSAQQSGPDAAYSVGHVPSNGPPIADAGFTLTPLTPSVANRSGTVTQQANHVLLGGHTQRAFINMSMAAIWSLPEESWGFISINAPSTNPHTDLAIKDLPSSVESRSGHTAVLREDGSALVILGGWVGDFTQAATPQLAILEMGDSFDDWQWSIPTSQPSGPGIYGHGATLLPGNVMMVYGGYSISSTSSDKAKRGQEGSGTEVPMFLNLTSMTWTDDYTNPASTEGGVVDSTVPSAGNSKSTQIGLGVGLGLGIPLVIAAILLWMWYRRHVKRERDFRDEVVRNLSQDAARYMRGADDDEMLERDRNGDTFPWNADSARDWYTGGHDPYVQGQRSLGYESLRGAPRYMSSPYPPLPPAAASSGTGTGRLRAARGLYQPTTVLTTGGSGGYEFGGHRTPGGRIEPIYEADEDEDEEGDGKGKVKVDGVLVDAPSGGDGSPTSPSHEDSSSDPFLTPVNAGTPRGSAIFRPPSSRSGSTPSPDSAARPQDPEVRDWVSDVDAADAMLAARIGPHGTTTTMTTATTLVAAADEARTASTLSESNRSTFSGGGGGAMSRSGSVRSHFRGAVAAAEARLGSSSGSSSHTWGTAKSNLAGLRDEGPGLLLGPTGDPDLDVEDDEDEQMSVPGSPSKYKARRSWFGSLRRVFSVGGSTSGSSRADSPTRESLMEGSCSDYEPRLVGTGPGGQLLKRKQGREAWDGKEGAGGDWDVERAVEQRLVQIMFTVPKERLRVVNAEIEKEEEVQVVDPGREDGYAGNGHCEEEKLGEDGLEELPACAAGQMPADALDTQNPVYSVQRRRLLEPAARDESIPRSPLTIHTAEAVKFERPRTRVLEMVDSIETLRLKSSPASSPER